MKTKVITYQAPNGEKISLTDAQVRTLNAEGRWPKNDRGEEYCQVSHGRRYGTPTCEGDVPDNV